MDTWLTTMPLGGRFGILWTCLLLADSTFAQELVVWDVYPADGTFDTHGFGAGSISSWRLGLGGAERRDEGQGEAARPLHGLHKDIILTESMAFL